MDDEVIALDIGFLPSTGAPLPVMYQDEHVSALVFFGRSTEEPSAETRVLVEASCMVATFGYPNDEAIPGHPLYTSGLRLGVFEVLNSSWKSRLIAQNEKCFPRTPPHYYDLRHFIITFQDSSFECLAWTLEARAVTGTARNVLSAYIAGAV
jgi:hypothetical protein